MACVKTLLATATLLMSACVIHGEPSDSAALFDESRIGELSPEDKANICIRAVRVSKNPSGRSLSPQDRVDFQGGYYNETVARLLNCTVGDEMLTGISVHYKRIPHGGQGPLLKNTYKMNTTYVTWKVAFDHCLSEGAHLAIPNSQWEAVAIRRAWNAVWPRLSGESLHVGAIRMPGTFVFITLQGETLEKAGYDAWSYVKSKYKDSNRCSSLSRAAKYYARPCDEVNAEYPFVCEKETSPC